MKADQRDKAAWAAYMRQYRQRRESYIGPEQLPPAPGFWRSLVKGIRWQVVAWYRRARGR